MGWAVVAAFFGLALPIMAQTPPSPAEVFTAVYGENVKIVGNHGMWLCPKDRMDCPTGEGPDEVDVLKVAVVMERSEVIAYAVTSLNDDFDCHACAPLLGMAVFTWREHRWRVQRARADATRFGTFGDPPTVSIVQIGPHLHGMMLTLRSMGQGYSTTSKKLLAVSESSIATIWDATISESEDRIETVGRATVAKMRASYRFVPNGDSDHFDLLVASRGRGYLEGKLAAENWNDTYHFEDGTYHRVRRQVINGMSAESTRK